MKNFLMSSGWRRMDPPTEQGATRKELIEQLRQLDEEVDAHCSTTDSSSLGYGFYHVTPASRIRSISKEGLDYFADSNGLEQVKENPSSENVRRHRLWHTTEAVLEKSRKKSESTPPTSRHGTVAFWPTVDTAAAHIQDQHSGNVRLSVLRIELDVFESESLYVGDYQAILDLYHALEEFTATNGFDVLSYLIESMGPPPELMAPAEMYWESVTECTSTEAVYDTVLDTSLRAPEVLFPGTVPWQWFSGAISSEPSVSLTTAED